MSLRERIALANWLLEGAASLVGLALPTFALVRLEYLPADLSAIAYIILPTVSLALVVAIFIRGDDIGRLSGRTCAARVVALALAGAVLTGVYAFATDQLVVAQVERTPDAEIFLDAQVKPLAPSDAILAILTSCHNDYQFALSDECPQAGNLKRLMYRDRGLAVGVLLGLMLAAQLCFVAAIVGGAWWLVEREHPRSPPPPEPHGPGAGGGE